MICPRIRRGAEGYTLTELLIVIAILALLVVALPMTFSQGRSGLEAKATVTALSDALRGARVAAIAGHDEASVIIDLSARTYAAEPRTEATRFGEDVALSIEDSKCMKKGRIAEIRFFADGGSSGCRLRIAAGRASYRITVQWLTGRVIVDELA